MGLAKRPNPEEGVRNGPQGFPHERIVAATREHCTPGRRCVQSLLSTLNRDRTEWAAVSVRQLARGDVGEFGLFCWLLVYISCFSKNF